MQRPRQHIIETASKKEFSSLIPDHWVTRELTPDYGLDFMIEIFNNENSTGSIFYVQLKGSDKPILNNTISYNLKRQHIEYYSTIPNPVLLLLYSTSTKQFWGLWSNKLKETLLQEGSEQETFKINLDKGHLVNTSFFSALETSFSVVLPEKINVTCNFDSEKGSICHQQILKWILYYFREYVECNNSLLPSTINFEYIEQPHNSLQIRVSNSLTVFDLSPIDISNDTFLYLPILQVKSPPEQFNEVLILISYLFNRYNVKNSIEIIKQNIASYDGEYLKPIYLFEIIKKGIDENNIFEIHNLSRVTIEKARLDIFQILNFSILILNDDGRLTGIYQDNLIAAIQGLEDKLSIAVYSYNLANSYRSTHELYLASRYYHTARKNDPSYLERDYWWFEYAGVLFLSAHYSLAERFYRKSYELNKEHFVPLIYSTLGDSLFFQGKFSDAKDEFDKFLAAESEIPFEEIFLKRQICENLELANLDKITFNIPKSIELTGDALSDKALEKLTEAISYYPLNGLAWFNYGILLKDNNDLESALTAFLTAACIQDWDKEAWRNCFLISLSLAKAEAATIICSVIIDKFGIESINYLADHIFNDPILDRETKLSLVDAITELASLKTNL